MTDDGAFLYPHALVKANKTRPLDSVLLTDGESQRKTNIVIDKYYITTNMRKNCFYTTRVAGLTCRLHFGGVLMLLLLASLLVPQGLLAATSADGYYEIYSASDLVRFRNMVNNTLGSKLCARLMNDIDLSGVCHPASDGNSEVSWTPISLPSRTATVMNPLWSGTFDGNGKTISNLYINNTTSAMLSVGLFGEVGPGAVIKNLTIASANVNNTYSSVSGTGILVGSRATGAGIVTIQNVKIDLHSSINGANYTGGICGRVRANIQDCACYASVQGTGTVGGIVGNFLSGEIKNVFCNASVPRGGVIAGRVESGSVAATGLVAYDNDEGSLPGIGSGTLASGDVMGYTKAQLKLGFVTYLLQMGAAEGVAWGQLIGTNLNSYPVLGETDNKVYVNKAAVCSCKGEYVSGTFSNYPYQGSGTLTLTHSDVSHSAKVDATCLNDGQIEYYECGYCHRRYSNEGMTDEVSDLTIRALGHDYYGESDKCSRCGTQIPTVKLGDNSAAVERVAGGADDVNGYCLLKFVASYDGTLEVTTDNAAVQGALWDGGKATRLAFTANEGDGAAFSLACNVVSGNTYYLGVRGADGGAIADGLTLNIAYAVPEGLDGNGTAEAPYELKTAEHLKWFAGYVNGANTTSTHSDACAKLADNIDLGSVCHAAGGAYETERSWTPISPMSVKWHGTFDGNGKAIANLYIKASQYQVGLFGYIGAGVIKNVAFENAKVVNDKRYTGILVGLAENATVEGVTADAQSSVVASDYYAGGIAGFFDGQIMNCDNRAAVNSTSNYVGGIFGSLAYSSTMAKRCVNYGEVTSDGICVGGIAGSVSGAIADCASYAAVKGGSEVGGIAGVVSKTLENVFVNAAVTATGSDAKAGLVAGRADASASASGLVAYDGEAALAVNGAQAEAVAVGSGAFASGSDCVAAFTKAQILSGEVAYRLNGGVVDGSQVWYQKLGDGGDACPLQTPAEGNTVYLAKGVRCDGKVLDDKPGVYSNVATYLAGHDYQETKLASGVYANVCSLCGTYESNKRVIKNFAGEGENLEVTETDGGAYSVAQLTLTDAKPYNSPVTLGVENLSYERSFTGKEGKWQALYVPFAIDCANLSDGYEVAEINMFHEYEQTDGTTKVVLEVCRLRSGTLLPLTPYVIRLKNGADGSQPVFKGGVACELVPSATRYIDCASVKRYYKFTGILEPKNEFVDGEDFVLGGGKISKAATNTKLSAQRWYLTAVDRNGGSVQQGAAKLQSISIEVVGEGEATGIASVSVATDSADAVSSRQGIYDLQGRRLNGVPASGVYIKDGRKYVK